MSGITEGYLVRHCQGLQAARDAALLDIAQDHALFHLYNAGLFDHGLCFKGGTALRKYRAGTSGRFSTDLDFSAVDENLVLSVLETLQGAEVNEFIFSVSDLGDNGRRASLSVTTPFGTPGIASKLELSNHSPILEPECLPAIPFSIHKVYGFEPPSLPIIRLEEAIAEKLARFRRVALVRDLYDLAWFAQKPFDEVLVRRLWVLKTYQDVVLEKRGNAPIDAEQILRERSENEFSREDIGYLVGKVEISAWIATVRDRYSFLKEMDNLEEQWIRCNPRDSYSVSSSLDRISKTSNFEYDMGNPIIAGYLV